MNQKLKIQHKFLLNILIKINYKNQNKQVYYLQYVFYIKRGPVYFKQKKFINMYIIYHVDLKYLDNPNFRLLIKYNKTK